jgi:hypothetical protein
MKTQNSIYKNLRSSLAATAILMLSVLLMAPSCREQRYYEDENYTDNGVQSTPPPAWAPAYSNVNVRYYYFPDQYMYYDVWSSQYVYYDGFGWVYATSYPAFVGPFDPYYAHVVIIDHHVHRPWRNHTHYVNHYPQYYYQNNYYGHRDNSTVRGYDENQGAAVFVPRKEGDKQPGSRKELQNAPDNKNYQNNGTEKNRQQPPLNNGEERPQQYQKQQQPDFQKQPPREDNRQKNINNQRNFERPQQQKREVPSNNFQKQQNRPSAPIQKSAPCGGMEKKKQR